MGSRLGRRVIHFANLPLKLLLPPPPLAAVREFAVKTVPSASKVDIRRCLESVYGFDVAYVRTLNMEGKKLKRGFYLAAKPDYKKAYITLRAPLSVSRDLFPIGHVIEERERKARAAAKAAAVVGDGDGDAAAGEAGKGARHWLDENREEYSVAGFGKIEYGNKGKERKKAATTTRRSSKRGGGEEEEEEGKFPWSGMRLATAKPRGRRIRIKGQKNVISKKRPQRSTQSRGSRKRIEA